MTTPKTTNSAPAASIANLTTSAKVHGLLADYTRACIKYGQVAEEYIYSPNFAGAGTESEAMRAARKDCEKIRADIMDVINSGGKEEPNAA